MKGTGISGSRIVSHEEEVMCRCEKRRLGRIEMTWYIQRMHQKAGA